MDLDDCFRAAQTIFQEFSVFDSVEGLKSLCDLSSKLRVHCSHLPTRKDDRAQYATSVRAYLRRQSNAGELLNELLNALLEHTADQQLKDEITHVSNRLHDLLQTKLVIIVAAMKDHEAQDLFNGAFAAEQKLVHEKISRLGKSLRDKGFGIKLKQLQRHYQKERDQWQPYGTGRNILQIIESIHQEIPEFQGRSLPKIEIEPRSDDFFGSNEQRAAFLNTIHNQRCLLIVDALSVFHPDISWALQTPALEEMKYLAIFVLAPSGRYLAYQEELYKLILDEMALGAHNHHLRFQDDTDPLCEFGIADDTTLRRRLRTIMPRIVTEQPRFANPKTTARTFEQHKVPEPRGWASFTPRFNP